MNKRPGELGSPGRLLPWVKKRLAQTGVDRAEDRADLAAKYGQNTNDDNCDQHQDQRVLDQILAVRFDEQPPELTVPTDVRYGARCSVERRSFVRSAHWSNPK